VIFVASRLVLRLEAEIVYLREQLATSQERNDRLTEAIANSRETPLALPRPPVALEPGSGWYDLKKPVTLSPSSAKEIV
jgi:hypothetical protein